MIRAVLVMEVGPPGSPCRRGAQTAVMSCRLRPGWEAITDGSLSAGQVCDEKTNMCEPLLTHRRPYDGIGTGGGHNSRDEGAAGLRPEPGGDLRVVPAVPGV